MAQRISRRKMLRNTAMAGIGAWIAGSTSASYGSLPSEKLNIACIGIGGRGRANLNSLANQNIVALCDVDDSRAGNAYAKFPRAKKFYDFRKMFDSMSKDIDAVSVSTPDHAHFHPAVTALELGKHLYCEKPMAHSVEEVRIMTDLARKQKVATQLGVQRHTIGNVHRVGELIRKKAIGEVRECHSWVGGSRGMPGMPKGNPPVPEHLKWDLWLGPARSRPYSPAYAPYNWRFWWDFGTGETGNWGCHILDIPYWALELKHPVRVEASGPEVDADRTPKSLKTRFQFPARGNNPPVSLHWYHSKSGPEVLKKHKLPHFGSGTLFIGSEGMLLCDFGKRKLYPEEKFKDFKAPDKFLADSPGFHKEWILACKGGAPATCNFDYSGPMTETVLLGNAAYRCGKSFDWKPEKIEAVGTPEARAYTHSTFRKGWEVSL